MTDYVNFKLGKMRKPQEFCVQDVNGKNAFIIQSDKSIGMFDKTTGKGRMCFTGCYFPHLSMCSIPFELTQEQVEISLSALCKKGDVIGKFGNCVVINEGVTCFLKKL